MPNALCHLDRANFLMDDTLRLRLRQLTNERAVAQTNRLPFDRLRANGVMLKSCDFSVHAELVEA